MNNKESGGRTVTENTWRKWSTVLLTLTLGGGLLYCLIRFAFPILLPFLLAWLIALPLRPLSCRISEKCHMPQKLCAALLLLFVVGFGAWGSGMVLLRMAGELVGVIERVIFDSAHFDISHGVPRRFARIAAKLGIEARTDAVLQQVRQTVTEMLGNALSAAATDLLEWLARFVTSLPTTIFVVVLTLLAGYYFCTDGDRIGKILASFLSPRHRECLQAVRAHCYDAFTRYVKAYLRLLLITFSLLFAGFLILGIEYALLLALLVAVLDMLPIFGVGTVLLPWGVLLLIEQRFFVGFGLILLYLIITLVRLLIEPRLVGRSLGLHPLLMLFATYVGFYLLGVIGMVLAPVIALLLNTAAVLFEKRATAESNHTSNKEKPRISRG